MYSPDFVFTDSRMKQKKSSLKERKQEWVDWDSISSPTPRYRGSSVREAARLLFKRLPKKLDQKKLCQLKYIIPQ